MFLHPDRRERDGLSAFADREEREAELKEIQHVVRKQSSKHHRK
jgi:hypothetical protein